MKVLLPLFVLVALTAAKSYEGYKFLRVTATNEDQLQFLSSLLHNEQLDFWHLGNAIDIPADVMVPPHTVDVLRHTLGLHGMNSVIINDNVQADIDAERERLQKKKDDTPTLFFDYDDYNNLETIYDELDALVERCPDGFSCALESLGETAEGRDILMLTIGTGGRPAHWFDSSIHSQEWLPATVLMNIINRLFDQSDEEAVHLLENYDYYFVPAMNPDGYEYSWNVDRMWNKNRGFNDESECRGTNLNKNYEILWDGSDTGNPCDGGYSGDHATSEPETQIIQDKAQELADQLLSWTSLHIFGSLWLWPYSDCSLPERWEDVERVADAACDAMAATHDTTWYCGNSCSTLYPIPGSLSDYVIEQGIIYSYGGVLRGEDYLPPPSEIQPSFEETWNGIIAMIDEIAAIEG